MWRQWQRKPGHCHCLTCRQGVTGSAQNAKSFRCPGHSAIRTRPPSGSGEHGHGGSRRDPGRHARHGATVSSAHGQAHGRAVFPRRARSLAHRDQPAPGAGFDADRARKSCGHAAENLATPRKLARTLPRSARPDISIRRKPKRSGWSDTFARSVRSQMRWPRRTRNCRLHAIAPARMLRRSAATARPQWQAQEC